MENLNMSKYPKFCRAQGRKKKKNRKDMGKKEVKIQ